MKRTDKVQLGLWAAFTLGLLGILILHTDILRLEHPTGEKYIGGYGPGQTDFNYAYVGARALLAGVNPYHHQVRELLSPFFPIETIGGQKFTQLYPPGQLILLLPLAKIWGADWVSAAQTWFHCLFASLLGLSVIVWALARRVVDVALAPSWLALFAICLVLNYSSELGLDRGQSDIVTSLLCWSAVICYLRKDVAAAMFLTVCGTSIKGYPVLFGLGMGLFAITSVQWKQALLGGTLGASVMVLPGAKYLGDALTAIQYRSDMFWPVYFNLGFRNVAFFVRPEWADSGRRALTWMALSVAVLAWFQARRALRGGSTSAQALWLTVYATAALGTMIGYSALSVSYNLIIVLPGLLVIIASQERLGELLALPRVAQHALGAALLCCGVAIFTGLLGKKSDPWHSIFPLTGFALVAFFLIALPVLIRALFQPVPLAGSPREPSASEA